MRAAWSGLVLLSALTACNNEERQRREDERAIAAVEAAQRQMPPLKPVALLALTAEDQGMIDGEGGRCNYSAAQDTAGALHLVTQGSFGWVRPDNGEMIRLAADTGSTPSPARTWSRYTGKTLTLRIEPEGPNDPANAPDPSREKQGLVTITVRDAWDRVIATGPFRQDCRF